jgi:hypothetical protein
MAYTASFYQKNYETTDEYIAIANQLYDQCKRADKPEEVADYLFQIEMVGPAFLSDRKDWSLLENNEHQHFIKRVAAVGCGHLLPQSGGYEANNIKEICDTYYPENLRKYGWEGLGAMLRLMEYLPTRAYFHWYGGAPFNDRYYGKVAAFGKWVESCTNENEFKCLSFGYGRVAYLSHFSLKRAVDSIKSRPVDQRCAIHGLCFPQIAMNLDDINLPLSSELDDQDAESCNEGLAASLGFFELYFPGFLDKLELKYETDRAHALINRARTLDNVVWY